MSIQRYLATRDAGAARRSFGIQLLSTVLSLGLLGLAGLAVLGYFTARPEDMKTGWSIATDADKLLAHFIVIGLPAGLTGLVIAAILAAAMSSLSSGLNSSSAAHKFATTDCAPAARKGRTRLVTPSCSFSEPLLVSHAERATRPARSRSARISRA